ncbi:MAG: 5-dehydro-2-deoxygluconokinase [Chlamydiae bacterium]|nr:5-dehydro-2-deoxygluconokinase [Chlamydiota bacterium]
MDDRELDLLCMGRAAVDLYSQQIGATLENATTFAKYVGGCPANIAIGSSRLGLKVGILSAVGDEAMGRFVRETLIHEGVDVSCLLTKQDHLTGLVLLGIDPPENFPLIFYRENCADMALTESDICVEMFRRTRALLITGTHCSTPEIFAVTKKAVMLAREAECEVILDIDYRPVLWGAAGHGDGEERYVAHEVVARRLEELFGDCSVIVGTEEEIRVAAGEHSLGAALSHIHEQSEALIVQKRGEQGCIAYADNLVVGKPFSIEVINVLGAGDAFMSGFLRGYLAGEGLERCCQLGNANGALVVTRHGCSPAMPYWEELCSFIDHDCLDSVEKQHHQMGRKGDARDLFFLAVDHRTHFEKETPEMTRAFKDLVTEAFLEVKKQNPDRSLGIIIDHHLPDEGFPTFRCIEEPGATPLEFLKGQEARHIIDSWPRHIGVKVLCPLPCDIKQLKRLYRACVETNREMLIEFVDPSLTRIAEVIDMCYQNDISPEWWKLPPNGDAVAWKFISSLIDKHDPHCHGILLLGQNRPLQELSQELARIRCVDPKIRGCAVGRSIWGSAAEKFFSGNFQKGDLIQEIANNFSTLIHQEAKII